MTIDENTLYRRALGAYATGVAVVTIASDGSDPAITALGMTINSFVSVSLSPRLILWCVDDASARGHLFAMAETFAVNVVHEDDRSVADRCARRETYRLGSQDVMPGPVAGSAPVLNRALARLSCRVHARHQMGDHLVIVGEVMDFDASDGDGILYYRGRYSHVQTA